MQNAKKKKKPQKKLLTAELKCHDGVFSYPHLQLFRFSRFACSNVIINKTWKDIYFSFYVKAGYELQGYEAQGNIKSKEGRFSIVKLEIIKSHSL